MERRELLDLIVNGMQPAANFSVEDANSAAINALFAELGLDSNSTIRDIYRHKNEVFALVEEAVDEILPKRLENVMGRFAEVKTFARDAQVLFNLKNLGKARARLSITKGARGGIYRVARLDAAEFQMDTETYTVGIFVTLEDLLLGTYTLAELFNNIMEGFEEIVYMEVVNALNAGAVVGGNRHYTVDGSTLTLEGALDEAIRIIKQYGNPVLLGFNAQISKLHSTVIDVVGAMPNISARDADDMRDYGYVQVYKGIKVIEIPNYLKQDTNVEDNEWLLDDSYLYVIPTDIKPVKVALKGDMVILDNQQPTGSRKMEIHKMMGVGVALGYNYAVIHVEEE